MFSFTVGMIRVNLRGAFRCAMFASALCVCGVLRAELVWPTSSTLFADGAKPEEILQPTLAGTPLSGAFGDVRNNGWKFHEGIDIRPIKRSRKGEPLDSVYCALDGKVSMINTIAGNSGYGRYVVVSHGGALDTDVYTLYAHLADVDSDISVGAKIKAGDKIGKMGRSAGGYKIAKSQAHLHFEIGVRLSDHFDRWYATKKFPTKNFFENYSGINLEGFDGLAFYQAAKAGRLGKMSDYIKSLPTAIVVRVYTRRTPDFAKIYPSLTDNDGKACGWDIAFTWHGMPKSISRIKDPRAGAQEGQVEIYKYSPQEISHKCRQLVKTDRRGNLVPTDELKDRLRRIFP